MKTLRDDGMAAAGKARGGFVLLAVLLVLLALLVLCAPFLATARNADRASGELADRARARIALDGAARHARARLSRSHPGNPDETPWYDDRAEIEVDNRFDPEFLNAVDPRGVMWDLEVEDVAGRVDLNSASPEVIANLLGTVTRLQKPLAGEEQEFAVYDPGALGEGERFAYLNGELLRLNAGAGGELAVLDRAVGTYVDDEGKGVSRGPRLPSSHGVGAYVVDQSAHAPVVWRLAGRTDEPRAFTAIEQVREAAQFSLTGEVAPGHMRALARLASVHGGVRAGARWQKPVRLVTPVEGGETHEIGVDDGRWINVGATVRVREGELSELRYVLYRTQGRIGLDRALEEDYDAWTSTVEVLARRPVNINTASRDVLTALFSNLKLQGFNSRITPDEAERLARIVEESRPFTGLEDWLRRVVFPAADIEELPEDAGPRPEDLTASGAAGFLDPADAVALYLNALNANDARLEFATMPFAFTSRDVFAMELRASINAESGVERTRAVRERVEVVVPQRELFTLWATQADFDDELRLTRDARGWATGPESTSRWDGGVSPPSRAWAHLGTSEGAPYLPGFDEPIALTPGAAEERAAAEHVFASREPDSWAQLWAARVWESQATRGRMLHFDHETRDLEGRYLPDEPVYRPTDDPLVQWAEEAEGGLMKPLAFSMWVRPDLDGDGHFLDVGGTSDEADRVSLLREGEDLVLRLLDGFGDHPATTETEATELRLTLAEGDGPGLPIDTWSHLGVWSTGTRPSQTGMLVNGLAHGVRRPGLTRLVSGGGLGATTLQVESTEGFPAQGPVRIGNEIIECRVVDDRTLEVSHVEAGPFAGFGGRLARLRFGADGVPIDLENTTTDHPSGASVEVYGYSAYLSTVLPAGASPLSGDLGSFRVARVLDVSGGMDRIQAGLTRDGRTYEYGEGYDANNRSGLELIAADDPRGAGADVMEAFSRTGGYAAIVQQRWGADSTRRTTTGSNAPTGGLEIVRYSGWSGTTLQIAARGDVVAGELERYGVLDPDEFMGGARAFVVDWDDSVAVRYQSSNGEVVDEAVQDLLTWQVYVVPISLGVPNATDIDFLPPDEGRSEYAQITRTDQAELTEWVRYDTIQANYGQLVRDEEGALLGLYSVLTSDGGVVDDVIGNESGGGGGGGGGGGPKGGASDGGGAGDSGGAGGTGGGFFPPPTSGGSARVDGALWDALRGEDELDLLPLTRAVWSHFQFRGVLGTFPHAHPAGSLVVPVFQVFDGGVEAGRPGARDAIFAVQGDPTHVGWPLVVHRAHLPGGEITLYNWTSQPGDELPSAVSGTEEVATFGFLASRIYVALEERCPEPILPGSLVNDTASDPRTRGRLVKWPSGERARTVAQVAIGGGFDGSNGTVPAALVDEVLFQSTALFRGLPGAVPASHTSGAALVLAEAASESSSELVAFENTLVAQSVAHGIPDGALRITTPFLAAVGDEIVCVSEISVGGGVARLLLADGGRGLLGTFPQAHQATELALPLEHLVVSTLTAGIAPGDSILPIQAREDEFPPEGVVLVGEELVHYTRRRRGGLEMPRGSTAPGAADEEGDGLFRGRYGTFPAAHGADTPVILFPYRYPDLWAERADVPELACFGFQLEQPGAWWIEDFWDAEEAPHGACRVGVLRRVGPEIPWDEDPDATSGLDLSYAGREDDEMRGIGAQADRVEWRVFVRYDAGAFDPAAGLAHGWKETPRLRRLGVSYTAPGIVLRSVDR